MLDRNKSKGPISTKPEKGRAHMRNQINQDDYLVTYIALLIVVNT
jgi:hypothetical protein